MKILITGGAGFIGKHTAAHFLRSGNQVIVLDNLSRAGSELNLKTLQKDHPQVIFEQADTRNEQAIKHAFEKHGPFGAVIHLAAQVAVTTSVENPQADFEINAGGTFNVLESCRQSSPEAVFLYSSTNKVYGDLEGLPLEETDTAYRLTGLPEGISEDQPLDFHSPYGCSKGCADQYVRDYARIYGMRTCVFRQSCIYGTEQFGVEDQGWVAWFAIAAVNNRAITIYGNGKQVRDLLWIEDLVSLYDRALAAPDKVAGKVFNVGGGAANAISLLEVMPKLEAKIGQTIDYSFASQRPGDQRFFVADTAALTEALGWAPSTNIDRGLDKLIAWIQESKELIAAVNASRFATI